MNKEHIHELTEFAMAYYNGDVVESMPVFNDDELDALALGIDLLGQELHEQVSSKDYFSTLFRQSSQFIFIVNRKGGVEHVNKKAIENITTDLIYEGETFTVFQLFEFPTGSRGMEDFQEFVLSKTDDATFKSEARLKGKNKLVPVRMSCQYIEQIDEFTIVAEDISKEKAQDQKLMRAILETQINEQNKIAKELHDSVTQNLSGAKMMLSRLNKINEDEKLAHALSSLLEIVDESIVEIRDLSHNLMPSYLRFPIQESISHLIKKIKAYAPFDIEAYINNDIPEIDQSYKSAIYRIIQEFSHNTVKYAKAKTLSVSITFEGDKIIVLLQDDGIGFDLAKEKSKNGIGINNILSRIKIFDEGYHFSSAPNKGTSLFFSLTL
mgnify:CR=1 FL=1